jgi:hypothetical protein
MVTHIWVAQNITSLTVLVKGTPGREMPTDRKQRVLSVKDINLETRYRRI